MITALDIEKARRAYVAAIGTSREEQARKDMETLIAQAKREHKIRGAS